MSFEVIQQNAKTIAELARLYDNLKAQNNPNNYEKIKQIRLQIMKLIDNIQKYIDEERQPFQP